MPAAHCSRRSLRACGSLHQPHRTGWLPEAASPGGHVKVALDHRLGRPPLPEPDKPGQGGNRQRFQPGRRDHRDNVLSIAATCSVICSSRSLPPTVSTEPGWAFGVSRFIINNHGGPSPCRATPARGYTYSGDVFLATILRSHRPRLSRLSP